MNLNFVIVFTLISLICNCSGPLKRPVFQPDSQKCICSFYIIDKPAQPKTISDCKKYLSKKIKDDLIEAICLLNLNNFDSALVKSQKINDQCLKQILIYDIDVEKGLAKNERFDRLQDILECSEKNNFVQMVKIRSKLAHYE